MRYHFEVIKSRNDRGDYYWWRIRSRNWKILATSETYRQKNNALRIVKDLMKLVGKKYCDYQYIDKTVKGDK